MSELELVFLKEINSILKSKGKYFRLVLEEYYFGYRLFNCYPKNKKKVFETNDFQELIEFLEVYKCNIKA